MDRQAPMAEQRLFILSDTPETAGWHGVLPVH